LSKIEAKFRQQWIIVYRADLNRFGQNQNLASPANNIPSPTAPLV